MTVSDSKNMLCSEINRCRNSVEWDNAIARRVVRERAKKKKRILYSSSLSTLAVAAASVFILLFGIDREPAQNGYYSFISRQVNGTYNVVFSTSSQTGNNGTALSDSSLFADEIGSTIDQALSMR